MPFQKGHKDFRTKAGLVRIGVSTKRLWKNPEYRKRVIEGHRGENNSSWKGENAKYWAKHERIWRKFGQPDTCEDCGKSGLTGQRIHWANISGKYKTDRSDWKRLCVPCHSKFDGISEYMKKNWRNQYASVK